ncbi:hypothetical protein D9M71_432830 [compost metagenome]
MNIRDLIRGEKFDAAASALEPLLQILAGFVLGIGLQFDDVESLFLEMQSLKLSDQRGLAEQEHMRATFRRTGRQDHQNFKAGLIELFGIIDQQIDFLAGERKLHHLGQDSVGIRLGDIQRLGHLTQHTGRIAGATGGHHHTLYRLLVGAGDQGLTQQGLATALGTGDHQQQLTVAGQVMQLSQHGFALGREKFEARHPWSKRVMTQLVMAEESLVGMQTSHRVLINL